jgi:hypothetical protein
MLGIFMKLFLLNQPMSFLIKWLAITMIVLRLSSEAFLRWAKSQLALVHSFSLQVKFVQSFSGISFVKMSAGLMDGLQKKIIPESFFSLAAVSTFTPQRGFFCLRWPEGLPLFVLGVVGLPLPPLRCLGVEVVLEVGWDAPSAREFFLSFLGLLAWVLLKD